MRRPFQLLLTLVAGLAAWPAAAHVAQQGLLLPTDVYITSGIWVVALAAASDPFATGADYLGLGTYYVTTGFFNTATRCVSSS